MEFAPPLAPMDVAAGPDGNVYVLGFNPNSILCQVYEFSPSGVLLQTFTAPDGLKDAYRIAIDPTGLIFITEQYNTRVSKFQIDMSTATMPLTLGHIKAMYR